MSCNRPEPVVTRKCHECLYFRERWSTNHGSPKVFGNCRYVNDTFPETLPACEHFIERSCDNCYWNETIDNKMRVCKISGKNVLLYNQTRPCKDFYYHEHLKVPTQVYLRKQESNGSDC